MKLYVYEHCPFCCRARMIFGLKQVPVEREVVLEGDAETPVRLVGRKVLPILRRPDGGHMAESMDIVHFVDGLDGTPIVSPSTSGEAKAWYDRAWPVALKLFIPRFTRADFAELATPEAREAYRLREEKAFGDLDVLTGQTPALIAAIAPLLLELETLLENRHAIDADDFLLYPLLRSLSIVADLPFGPYAHTYMERLEGSSGVPLLFDQAA